MKIDQFIQLKPVREPLQEYDKIEEEIKKAFWHEVYKPLVKLFIVPSTRIKNAKKFDALYEAVSLGKVTYENGFFRGEFSAEVSKELKAMGAKWQKGAFVFQGVVPTDVLTAFSRGDAEFRRKVLLAEKELAKILPEKITDTVKAAKVFDRVIDRVELALGETSARLSVQPKLSPAQRKKLSDEWQDNLDLFIKNFTAEEIPKLRKRVQETVLEGNRYKSLVDGIKESYGVTEGKAKFLARQETSLLVTKLKELRYTDAGIKQYMWRCVAGSKNHPVRPSHKVLDGKIFFWNDPPITTPQGEPVRRNNPGQDYNCRCFAIPLIRKSDRESENTT